MADTATLTLEFKTLADLSGLQDLVGQVQDGLESVTSAAGEMGAGIQDGLDRVTSSAESLGSGIETHVTKPAEAATPVVEKFDAGMDLMQLAMGKVKIALAALGISFGIAEIVRFASETLSASAASEQAALSLQLLIGNADVANQKLQQLHEFSLASGISLQELADAARQLVLAGTGPDNLVPRIKSFAEISATAGENIDSVVAAYQRMRFAIENGTTPIVRGMGQTSAATVLLIRTLMDETGKSESEVLQMFREHKVTIDLLNKAIAEATTGQGRYADAVSARSNTLRGAIGAVETAWHSLLLTVAEPIRDAITPVLTQLATKLRDLKPVVDEVGQRIGDLVQAFGKVAADEGWKNAISDAWRVLIDEISKMIVTGIGSAFKSLGQETLATHQAQSFINVYKDEIAAGENKVQAALVAVFAAVQSDITGKVIKAGQDTGENYVMAMADKIVSGKDQIAAALQALLGPLDAFDSRMKELGVGFKSLTAAGEGFDFTKAGLGAGGVPGADIGTTFRGAGAGEAGGADAAKTATDALAASKERLAIAEEHYQVELERVSVLESSGAISSTQAMAQRRQAAAAALEQLQKLRPEILALQQAELRAGDTKGFLQLQLELERLDLQTLKLHADMASNTFFGQMRAGLVQLTNEWSNLGKQIGGFLTQQFQNFASGAANALTSLILRTGDWRQAIVSLAQSFVRVRRSRSSRDRRASLSRFGRVGAGWYRCIDRHFWRSRRLRARCLSRRDRDRHRYHGRIVSGRIRWRRFHRWRGRPVRRVCSRPGIRLQRACYENNRARATRRSPSRSTHPAWLRPGRLCRGRSHGGRFIMAQPTNPHLRSHGSQTAHPRDGDQGRAQNYLRRHQPAPDRSRPAHIKWLGRPTILRASGARRTIQRVRCLRHFISRIRLCFRSRGIA